MARFMRATQFSCRAKLDGPPSRAMTNKVEHALSAPG